MKQQNKAYCDHLFDSTTDGYIQVIKINNNDKIKIYNTENKSLRLVVEKLSGLENVFISSNTYYIPKRAVNNIRQYRSLYIDLDLKKYYKAETVYMVYQMAYEDKIPMPTMIVDSGRGVHLYWRIKNAPYVAMRTWQELEDYLYHKLKFLGADILATDGSRLLRLPGTINSKNNAECKIITINNELEYSMYDLREKYLNYNPKKYQQLEFEQVKEYKKRNFKCINNKFFNSYSLHLGRAQDLKTLCRLRNNNVKGCRNFILHCFAYWEGIYTRDPIELEKKVIEFNNSFINPLKETEVQAILRCVPKSIKRFIDYEQGIRSGEVKRVTKGMRDKQGYWYRNQTLIDKLEITSNEQKHLKIIIGTEEKYRRNNSKRYNNRRNGEGLTFREQQKQDKIKAVKKLREKGLSYTEISKESGISRRTVITYAK